VVVEASFAPHSIVVVVFVFAFVSVVVARPAAFTRRHTAQLCSGGHGIGNNGKLLVVFIHDVDLFCSGKHGGVGGGGGGVRHLHGRERFRVVVVAVVLRAVELASTIQEIFARAIGGVLPMNEGFVPQDAGIRVGDRSARASFVISVAAICTPGPGVFVIHVGSRCVRALVGCSERPWCYSNHLRICNQPVHRFGTVVGQHRRRDHLRICNQPVCFIGTVVRQHCRCCHLCR
jgi:hypothetical protein